jgi:hypothetical protein
VLPYIAAPERGNLTVHKLHLEAVVRCAGASDGRTTMLWTLALIMLVLWGLGLVTSYTLGGFIHILVVVAVVVVLVRLIRGRRVIERRTL